MFKTRFVAELLTDEWQTLPRDCLFWSVENGVWRLLLANHQKTWGNSRSNVSPTNHSMSPNRHPMPCRRPPRPRPGPARATALFVITSPQNTSLKAMATGDVCSLKGIPRPHRRDHSPREASNCLADHAFSTGSDHPPLTQRSVSGGGARPRPCRPARNTVRAPTQLQKKYKAHTASTVKDMKRPMPPTLHCLDCNLSTHQQQLSAQG